MHIESGRRRGEILNRPVSKGIRDAFARIQWEVSGDGHLFFSVCFRIKIRQVSGSRRAHERIGMCRFIVQLSLRFDAFAMMEYGKWGRQKEMHF